MKNQIDLSQDYSNEMTGKLNLLLSNVQILYMNVRGFHWNIVGKQFFALHKKYEEVYNQLNEMADEIAERVLMLGGSPLHSFSEYIKISAINERLNISSADETVAALVEDTIQLLKLEREILAMASGNDDEATAGLMSEFIGEQEKMIWMLNALLKQ
ncbi:MAG: DNA starvation/stationary phase protection protein [Prolixibacteraceae bacterium]|nr:DNA starvation/stationary phase protection protein [Prolixibacteraceae bacterium]